MSSRRLVICIVSGLCIRESRINEVIQKATIILISSKISKNIQIYSERNYSAKLVEKPESV